MHIICVRCTSFCVWTSGRITYLVDTQVPSSLGGMSTVILAPPWRWWYWQGGSHCKLSLKLEGELKGDAGTSRTLLPVPATSAAAGEINKWHSNARTPLLQSISIQRVTQALKTKPQAQHHLRGDRWHRLFPMGWNGARWCHLLHKRTCYLNWVMYCLVLSLRFYFIVCFDIWLGRESHGRAIIFIIIERKNSGRLWKVWVLGN